MVRGIVANGKLAEGWGEPADAEVELVGDANIEERHADFEAVARDAHLDARRDAAAEVDRDLERDFGRRAVEGDPTSRLLRRDGHVIELDRTCEVATNSAGRFRRRFILRN